MAFSHIYAGSQPIKVAMIDSGFDFSSTWKTRPEYSSYVPKMCEFGHVKISTIKKNLVGVDRSINKPKEMTIHGTHVAGLIAKNAGNSDYCIISYDYYVSGDENENLRRSNNAIQKAINDGVSIINYSGGGYDKDQRECALVKQALDKGIKFVAAAGNNKKNLDDTPFFPAMCDKRVIVVENSSKNSKTNFSKKIKTLKIEGDSILSLFPNDGIGRMSGSSQSTAIATGILVKIMHEERILEESTKKITD
jgi:subtilisin family serine protease